MGKMGGDSVRDKLNKKKVLHNAEEDSMSKFIISPNNVSFASAITHM